MTSKITQPQEIELYNIIPAIRRSLFLEMKAKGLEQKKIAALLRVTEAAISQYSSNKRASEIKLSPSLRKEISLSAEKIINNASSAIEEIQRILSMPETRTLLCSMHKKSCPSLKMCSICSRCNS